MHRTVIVLAVAGAVATTAVAAAALSSSDPSTVRAVLDAIGAVAPTVEVDPAGVNIEALQQLTVIKTLLVAGMVMGLVIGVAAFLVSVTDRAVERRSQITALALIGARPRVLRTVQCLQVVLPLAVGLLLALVAGKRAEGNRPSGRLLHTPSCAGPAPRARGPRTLEASCWRSTRAR